ncbi:MAG: carboxypeptidase regulatory-like domain-containing protein [Myxococcaceae bacterium]
MRKWILSLAALALLLGGAVAHWPPGSEAARTPQSPAPVALKAVTVAAQPGEQGLTLEGRVLDPFGKPVPNAEVMLASSAQQSLAAVPCPVCEEPLLSCFAKESAALVLAHVEQHQAELTPAVSTRSDEEGKFKFTGLSGVSFSVWARANGFGASGRERAAPGESIEVVLTALRAISGTVLDESGREVAGATVDAISSRFALTTRAETDGSGRFELKGLGEGPFYLVANARGHLPSSKQRVEAGPDAVRMILGRPRKLEVATRSEGEPVEATVSVTASHLSRRSVAREGLITFDGLYKQEVVVSAELKGRTAVPRTLTLTAPVTRVELDLQDGGLLLITVVDEQGQPVTDPRVELTPSGRADLPLRRKAKTGERVTLGPLIPGSYQLEVEAAGFKDQRLPIALSKGETHLDVVMGNAVSISGRVLDEYGRAAPGISVLVNPTGGSVVSDDQGRFVTSVPSAGHYELHAHHSDWGGGRVTVNAPEENIELTLQPQAGVQVTVQLEGRRVEGAEAYVYQEKIGSFRSDRPSGADGVVLLRGLPPGTYSLIAQHPGHLPSTRQQLSVEDGQLLKVTAELRAGSKISGTVVNEEGAPVPGANVSVIPRRITSPTQSDENGVFEVGPLVPGQQYRVKVAHASYEPTAPVPGSAGGPPLKITLKRRPVFRGRVLDEQRAPIQRFSVNEHQVDAPDGRFELPLSMTEGRLVASFDAAGFEPTIVESPASPELGEVTLKKMESLEGKVLSGTGPVSGAIVSCSACEESVMTDEQGRFILARPALSEATFVARKGKLSGSKRASPTRGPVEIRIGGGTKLTGRIFSPGGQPAPGVELEISGDEDPTVVVTAQDGSYSAELTPGSYRFRLGYSVLGAGWGTEEVERLVMAEVSGAEQRLDFGSAPGGGSLTVRLQPHAGYTLWLVRGDPPASLDSPFMGLSRLAYAQVVFQPLQEKIRFAGLSPGRYTVIWGSLHGEGEGKPQIQRVDIPGSTEIALVQ